MVNLFCVLFFLLLSSCGGAKSGGNFLDELRDSVGLQLPVILYRRNSNVCTIDDFIVPQFQNADCIF